MEGFAVARLYLKSCTIGIVQTIDKYTNPAFWYGEHDRETCANHEMASSQGDSFFHNMYKVAFLNTFFVWKMIISLFFFSRRKNTAAHFYGCWEEIFPLHFNFVYILKSTNCHFIIYFHSLLKFFGGSKVEVEYVKSVFEFSWSFGLTHAFRETLHKARLPQEENVVDRNIEFVYALA